MTMTFKEWFDSKDEITQEFVKNECHDWLDLNSPDYYKPMRRLTTVQDILSARKDNDRRIESDALAYAMMMNMNATYKEVNTYVVNNSGHWIYDATVSHDNLVYLPIDFRKKLIRDHNFTKEYDDKEKIAAARFTDWLFAAEDYSDLNMDTLRDGFAINDSLISIFGLDKALSWCKKHWRDVDDRIFPSNGERSILFDTLFFGEDGWTEEQKKEIIVNIAGTYHGSEKNIVDHLIKNLCTVNMETIEYFYEIVRRRPYLAQHLYDEKKPDEELTGTESTEMTYRYPKWLRKLFIVMGCCARNNISASNLKLLQKEGAVLLKLYNYDFHQYFQTYMVEHPVIA